MVLNYTWDEVEAELVLRNLEEPIDDGSLDVRPKLHRYYLKLHEECRMAASMAKSLFQLGNE